MAGHKQAVLGKELPDTSGCRNGIFPLALIMPSTHSLKDDIDGDTQR
jgi:hypothetical protein